MTSATSLPLMFSVMSAVPISLSALRNGLAAAAIRDVTDRKRVELELIKAREGADAARGEADGVDVINAVRELLPRNIPAILMTSDTSSAQSPANASNNWRLLLEAQGTLSVPGGFPHLVSF